MIAALLASAAMANASQASTLAMAAGEVSASFRQSLIFVRASVDGGPEGMFLLDTGASETVIDARYATLARVKLGGPITLTGGGGVRDARQGEDAMLHLPGGPSGRLNPAIADLSAVARDIGQRLDGILGDDFLKRFVVELDYRDQRVFVRAASDVAPPADSTPMRLAKTPFLVARVRQGRHIATAEFQIDTGSNTALDLWRPFAGSAFPDARGLTVSGLGVAGRTENRRARFDSLETAGQRIPGPEANLDDEIRPDDADARYGGVIGAPAWAGLDITLDFPRQRFWIR
jgi:hypothetical protein